MEQCAVAVAKPVYTSYVTSLLMLLLLRQQRQALITCCWPIFVMCDIFYEILSRVIHHMVTFGLYAETGFKHRHKRTLRIRLFSKKDVIKELWLGK